MYKMAFKMNAHGVYKKLGLYSLIYSNVFVKYGR